jgi:hypothetical protein
MDLHRFLMDFLFDSYFSGYKPTLINLQRTVAAFAILSQSRMLFFFLDAFGFGPPTNWVDFFSFYLVRSQVLKRSICFSFC